MNTIENSENIISKIHRFRIKPSSTSSVEPTSSPVLVEFKSIKEKLMVLKAAKKLHKSTKFKDIYINPDQSEVERNQTKELVKQRNESNKQLENEGCLNKPFRYGIRDNRVIRVYVEKRTH